MDKTIQNENTDEVLTFWAKIKIFLITYWRGLVIVLIPLILSPLVIGDVPKWKWCLFTLVLMAIYWVTECIPLPVTSFLPIFIFPLTGVMTTEKTCNCYINDTVIMFLGSLMLAYAVEQSGLHIRMALYAVKLIGYSRKRQLFAISFTTMFVSMWITNTAATSMMVPICFALLSVYEKQNLAKMYITGPDGEYSSRMTTCFFCAVSFSATIGGIGTLVGTVTNLVHKGLFHRAYPLAPEELTFVKYCIFAVPYMLLMELALYFWFLFAYMGMFRPKSEDARSAQTTPEVATAIKQSVTEGIQSIGPITYWELMVIILFLLAILLFFFLAPGMIDGWAIRLLRLFNETNEKFIRDSVPATFVVMLMCILPSSLAFFNHFKSSESDKPRSPIQSVLVWKLLKTSMPFSFMFLLGAGFALSEAAKKENTNLNEVIANAMKTVQDLPVPATILIVLIFTISITNLASNVVVCNVITPIAMQLAEIQHVNPLWYSITAGFAASYCFLLPVGTPGNLIIQSAASIRTKDMIVAGSGLSLSVLIISWFAMYIYAPMVFNGLNIYPSWINGTTR